MATARTGPTLAIAASCEGCCHLRFDFDVYRCAHPKASSVAEPMLCSAHREPRAPDWCPELPGARLALLVDLARTLCRKCGRTVEPVRECYAIPTCFACLPPPPPLPVHPGFAAWQKRQEDEERAREAQKESE